LEKRSGGSCNKSNRIADAMCRKRTLAVPRVLPPELPEHRASQSIRLELQTQIIRTNFGQ